MTLVRRTLAVVSLLAFVATGGMGENGSRHKAHAGLEKRLTSVQQQKHHIRSQIKQVKKQVHVVRADLQEVDGRMNDLHARIDRTSSQLDASRAEQRNLHQQLKEISGQLVERQKRAKRRLRAMYMQGDGSAVSLLIGSGSVAEFASRKALLQRIAKADRELFEGLRDLHAEVRVKTARKDRLVVEIAGLKEQQRGQQAQLAVVRGEKQAVLSSLQRQQAALRHELDELDAQSRAIEAQIRAYQAANRGDVSPFRGRYGWPVRGRVTSGFGSRYHPILHERRMHTGIDISASSGTPISAAAPGRVMTSGYQRGYGNTVTIDHGGGVSTLYGHCSRIYVRAGQRVERGTRIAAVGSTGMATGPHLHFEVRQNGHPVNPSSRL